jgi:hypothetical protein
MKRTSQPAQAVASDSDDYLDTDDEVNEFENGMQIDADEDDEDEGVAQWEPDSWDMAADDDDEEDDDEDTVQHRESSDRRTCTCLTVPGLSSVPLSTLAKARSKMNKVSKYQKGESSKSAATPAGAREASERTRTRIESRESKHA